MASLFLNPWGCDPSLLCPCCGKGGKPWAFPGIQHTSTHSEGPGWSGMLWDEEALVLSEWGGKDLIRVLGILMTNLTPVLWFWYFVYLRICLNAIKCDNLDCFLLYLLYHQIYLSLIYIYIYIYAVNTLNYTRKPYSLWKQLWSNYNSFQIYRQL